MITTRLLASLALVSAFSLAACSSGSDSPSNGSGGGGENGGGAGGGANGADGAGDGTGSTHVESGTMSAVSGFGSNPGALTMYTYVPADVPANAPVVVAMHGCTQSAADYVNAGWNDLADQEKFYVVYPEQSTANNSNKCFNWFQEEDITRDSGEALSIKQMVDWVKTKYSVDATKVYVTGLSAGGAMTSVMLAAYPDVFAAGAIMSGIAYRCATTEADAFTCMNPGKSMSAGDWGNAAKQGDPSFSGTYPRLSVWHGQSDTTVNEANAADIVTQWAALTGISQTPDVTETVSGATHTEHKDASGRVTIERWSIPGMSHGTSLDPKHGCGVAASYMLDEGLCSTAHAWSFFTGGPVPTMTHSGGSSTGTGTGSGSISFDAGSFTWPTFDAGTFGGFSWPTLPSSGTCQTFTDTNIDHVMFGRAHLCGSTFTEACANGSNADLGAYAMVTTTIHSTGLGQYDVGACK